MGLGELLAVFLLIDYFPNYNYLQAGKTRSFHSNFSIYDLTISKILKNKAYLKLINLLLRVMGFGNIPTLYDPKIILHNNKKSIIKYRNFLQAAISIEE